MFSYMTDLELVDAKQSVDLQAEGHSLENLLYHFLDELLFNFLTGECIVCKYIEIMLPDGANDILEDATTNINPWKVKMRGYGEKFQPEAEGGKHKQGTEIKAITKHEMRINRNNILNMKGPNGAETPTRCDEMNHPKNDPKMGRDILDDGSSPVAPVDLYVLVDI